LIAVRFERDHPTPSVKTTSEAVPTFCLIRTLVMFHRIKRPERESDNLSEPRTEANNARGYTSAPHTSSWCGAYLHKGEFPFKLVFRVCLL
jgi:hypothetical protein